MKKYLPVFLALIIGTAGGYILGTSAMPAGHSMSGMQGEMDAMMAGLDGMHGDTFDQAFLREMIVHHEGAVMMAEAALQHARHEELRAMANAIIDAQTAEIKQMQDWLAAWYPN